MPDFRPYMNCETCPKCWSGKCRQCPKHQAELAAFQRKIDNRIHAIAIEAFHPRTKAPDSKLAPIGAEADDGKVAYPKSTPQLLSSVCGVIPQGASDYQLAPLAQSGQSSRTEQANRGNMNMSMPCSEVAGSNPAGSIPASLFTPRLLDQGAGRDYFQNITNHSVSCANYNYSEQHHVTRGSISRHMMTPSGSVFITFPTLPPCHDSKESDSHEQPGRRDSNLVCPSGGVESPA